MLQRVRTGLFVVECDRCLRRLVLGNVTREVAEADALGFAWVRHRRRRGLGYRASEFDLWHCPQCEALP